jgi:hypothetical protein
MSTPVLDTFLIGEHQGNFKRTQITFKPGFRLSVVDVLVLILGLIFSIIAGSQVWWLGVVIGFVVGHFFLFCNLFRISRKPELIWAAVFTCLTASTIILGQPDWIVTFSVSLLVALVLIYIETRRPHYHGIGWQRFNPGLFEWWENQSGK